MVYEETDKGLAPFAGELSDSAVAAMERAEDDAIVVALTTGRGVEEYLYHFPVEGKEVVGISTAGAFEIARLLGNIEVLPDMRAEKDEATYHVVVRVKDTLRNVTVMGAARQPLNKQVKVRDRYGRETEEYEEKPDHHAWTIAVNKAQRNGILRLTSNEAKVRIVETFLEAGKSRRLPAEASPGRAASPRPVGEVRPQTGTTDARRRKGAPSPSGQPLRSESPQSGQDISLDEFRERAKGLGYADWNGVRQALGVASMKEWFQRGQGYRDALETLRRAEEEGEL